MAKSEEIVEDRLAAHVRKTGPRRGRAAMTDHLPRAPHPAKLREVNLGRGDQIAESEDLMVAMAAGLSTLPGETVTPRHRALELSRTAAQ
jgi:hypothetical protein